MQSNVIDVRIQNAYKTEAIWRSTNPTPLKGEICISSDTNNFKIGDGIHSWVDLGYILNPSNLDCAYQKTFDLTVQGDYSAYITGDDFQYDEVQGMYCFLGDLEIWVPRQSDYALNLVIGLHSGGTITTPQLTCSIRDEVSIGYNNVTKIKLNVNRAVYLTKIQILEVNLDLIPTKVSQLENDLGFTSMSVNQNTETLYLFIPNIQ